MSYENAVATKMMATHCVCCGRALVDAVSVSLGIGPECRQGYDGGISAEAQDKANKLVFRAALAAQGGSISLVQEIAEEIRGLGLGVLADKVGKRFRNAERNTEIVISLEGDQYRVETPFRRGAKEEFIAAWRAIPGRRFKDSANYVPVVQKAALLVLLRQFFGGKMAKGPKGLFRIQPLPVGAVQGELKLEKAEGEGR